MRTKLIQARQSSGLSVRDIAQTIGISTRYYHYIETGARTGKYEIWVKLSSIFGIPQDVLRLNTVRISDAAEKDN